MFKNHSKLILASLLSLPLGALSTSAFSASVTYLNYSVATRMLTTTVNGVSCALVGNNSTQTYSSQVDLLASALIDAKTSGAPISLDCSILRIIYL